ncbi:hypothetical protein G7Y89_g10284 [Cudoniella acicularis]|uniref:Apple domain-containing protein n=1 Tax=Cudoniella acicularis TaxID=354080 RepID=A0A8H4RFD8_9HELO|nr:hypothetical protein G7Y89_g10284 [Cudoniella acicularis]
MKTGRILSALLLEAGIAFAKPYGKDGIIQNEPALEARATDLPTGPPVFSIGFPSGRPSWIPSERPSWIPSGRPSWIPTVIPTTVFITVTTPVPSGVRPSPSNPVTAILSTIAPMPFIRCYYSIENETSLPTSRPISEADVLGFCSNYIQPSITVTKTRLVTSTTTLNKDFSAAVTKTATTVAPGATISALCPIAAANQTCGLSGWGYAANNIYSGAAIDAPSCHQLCLKNDNCASFQIVSNTTDPSPQCNLYKVPSGGNNTVAGATSPYAFYDRDCPDFSPSACGLATAQVPTAVRRDENAHTVIPPWFLSTLPSDDLSSICSCVIRTPLPTAYATSTISSATVVTASVTKSVIQYYTVTTTIGGTVTAISSVH